MLIKHMDNLEISGKYIPLLDGVLFEIEYSTINNKIQDTKAVLVEVIDVSGSMAGAPINTLNECLITNPPENLKNNKTKIRIVFNHEAQIHNTNLLIGSGGTNFANAFTLLIEVIKNKNLKNSHVLFITDGQDNITHSNVNNILEELTTTLINYNVIIHLIGYGSQHDIRLMEDLVQKIPKSTFDFASDSANLRNFVNIYSEIIIDTSISCDIFTDDINVNVRSNINIISNRVTKFLLKGAKDIPKSIFLEYRDPITNRKISKQVTNIKYLSKQVSNVKSLTNISDNQLILEYIESCIQSLKNTNEKNQEIQKIRELLKSVSFEIAKEKKTNNKLSLCNFLEELRLELNSMTTNELGKIATNDIVIRAVTLASKYSMKQGFQNKLAERILKNNDDTIQKDIRSAIQKINLDLKDYECEFEDDEFVDIWSMQTWKDVFNENKSEYADGDVMCICLKVARSNGVAIIDPSQLKILTVQFEQCVSWQTFISLYKLELAKDESGINIIGGFDFDKAMNTGLLKGMNAMKEFNAVFPLYISKENWLIAEHVIKWTIGHMTTMDYRGFSEDQLRTVPFLILEFMERKNHKERSELYTKILNQIKMVCIQYMNVELLEETNNWVINLIDNKLTREQCPNLQVLVGRVLCMDDTSNKRLLTENVYTLFCEQIRRLCRGSKGLRTNNEVIDTIAQIFQIPTIDQTLIEKAKQDNELKFINEIEVLETPQIDFDYDIVSNLMEKYLKKINSWKIQLENNFGLPINTSNSSYYEIVDIITWGIYNSNNITCYSIPKFATMDTSYQITDQILKECWNYKKMCVINEIKTCVYGQIKSDSFAGYCNSNAVIPPFAKMDPDTNTVSWTCGHLYGGTLFGDLLAYLRSCNYVVNKKGKRDFFYKYCGWTPGKSNKECF